MRSVIKGASYILAHTPDMVSHNGTTWTQEKIVNPDGDYLKKLPSHIRSFEDCLSYWPNQIYIGNKDPEELEGVPFPYYDKKCDVTDRYGKYGQMMPEAEFYLLMQAVDVFDLIELDKDFVSAHKEELAQNKIIDDGVMARVKDGCDLEKVQELVDNEGALGLYLDDKLVGCCKRAHEIDDNLSADYMCENLAAKASDVLAMLHAVKAAGIEKGDVDYVIDCCEEACGDENQRGGGNFAKAAAEICGFENATGSDARGFCAGPTHAMIEAASLVAAGTYKCVMVSAGGCTAKLGMNGKNHVEKDVPILEDMLGGFAVVVVPDDGVNPYIDLEHIGRHTVGTGSAPQNVMQVLVYSPLEAAGLSVTDVDKYAPELQNPDITKPGGAGDVPLANYKMIAALGVKKGQLERKDIPGFAKDHGFIGWAPTQGHIPSGVPAIGVARDSILAGKWNRLMLIGKGSLFLGRLTNLFDGVSYMICANDGKGTEQQGVSEDEVRKLVAEAMKDFAQALMAKADED
ncbi:MAG: glycine/sarcosine/betaine reductase complex component C subunit beta [Atopobiaceae bacterium]